MDNTSFYETETQVEAKNWQMIKRRKDLRAHLARLQHDLDAFAKSWVDLGRNVADCSDMNTLIVSDDKISISRRSTGWKAEVPCGHFDLDAIENLAIDLEKTKGDLVRVSAQVNALGLDI